MKKGIVASAVIVLLAGSGAIAQIDLQWEDWDFGLTNDASMSGAYGNISTTQVNGGLGIQSLGVNPDPNGDPTVTAEQGFGVALYQEGSFETWGAPVTLYQNVGAEGVPAGTVLNHIPPQAQSVDDLSGSLEQYQGGLVFGSQDLTKEEGSIADVNGLSIAASGMGQTAANTCAGGSQLSLLFGLTYSELYGTAQASGEVHTDMDATVQQYQTANNP